MRTTTLFSITLLLFGLTACTAESTETVAVPTGETTETPAVPDPAHATFFNESAGDSPNPTAPERPMELNMNTAAEQANDFAVRLYAAIAQGESGNLFFSPLSIHTALSMTYTGARGATARQMRDVLAFRYAPDESIEHAAYSQLLKALNDPPMMAFESWDGQQAKTEQRPVFELVVANRLWGQQGLAWDRGFMHLTETEYQAGLRELDFRASPEPARTEINEWVEQTTRERIKDLIAPGALTPDTRLVLTNAIYFKANWAEAFAEHATQPADFRLAGGETVQTPTMQQQGRFGYRENERWQALEMPYERGELSMLVLLPREAEGALAGLESELAGGDLLGELHELGSEDVRVWLPKFSTTHKLELKALLAGMGMPLAFGDEADFGGMTREAALKIDDVIHKAFVEIDEKGTEAAAATAVTMRVTSAMPAPREPKIFRADRPFLFLIRHNTSGAILFTGRVMDPRG